ncbi:unnamed protein product [Rhizophagus irregularis]|nr:unnamed protein product [Rhizophagus irregularis]
MEIGSGVDTDIPGNWFWRGYHFPGNWFRRGYRFPGNWFWRGYCFPGNRLLLGYQIPKVWKKTKIRSVGFRVPKNNEKSRFVSGVSGGIPKNRIPKDS